MVINLMTTFIKTFSMNLCIALSFVKIKGLKNVGMKLKTLISINIVTGILYSIIYELFFVSSNSIFMNLICNITYTIIFSILIGEMDKKFVIVMLLSICFSLFSFSLACFVLYIIMTLSALSYFPNCLVEYLFIGVIQFILMYYFFRIKRFKNGFSFINEGMFSSNINLISIILCIVLLVYAIYTFNRNEIIATIYIIGITSGTMLIISFIKKCITKYYKTKMKDRTVETLTEQLKEKDQTIENLKSELSKTLKINHKYNHRISAMEKAVSKLEFNEEFASEHGDIVALVKELSENYKSELLPADNQEIIQKTNVFAIDNMLEYMATKASKSNIALKVEVKCDVKDITENIIDKNKLETLLADHINDAIIAIQHCTEKSGKILVKFEIHDSMYEVKIYDTGIEFEINTLLQLGKHQVTTHKDSGGSGIGFMTTFDTLRACKGSLIIEEYNNQTTDYTKAIVARFDNNNEYKICSYRSDEIKIEAEKQENYENMENIMPLLTVAKEKQE